MQIFLRIIGGALGIAAAFPVGMVTGCGFYEAAGPRYAQCGYEFEGMGHVLVAIGVFAFVLGFLGQWIAGWLWRRSRRGA